MKIYLSEDCYKWLVDLKILKAYIVPEESINHVVQQLNKTSDRDFKRYELCYDDQIYLENGYLVGVLMRQILKVHQLQSQKLLKIRKITVLKKSQNWEIIQDVLSFLDYPFNQGNQTQNYGFDFKEIERILEFLYNEYGPFASNRKSSNQRYFHIDSSRLHAQYQKNRLKLHLDGVSPYSFPDCNNLLEYTCFVIHKSFDYQLKIDQCMGLLIDRGKYLKAIIVKGLVENKSVLEGTNQKNDSKYVTVLLMYQQILNSIDRFDELIIHEPSHLQFFMEIFASGVLSKCQNVAKIAGLLIENVQNQSWFKEHGVRIMARSEWPDILNLLIQKSKGFFGEVFNQKFEEIFVYEEDFLSFLIRFLPVLSRSIYCREVLESFSLQYLICKMIDMFDPDNIESSQPKVRQLCRQALTILFKNFFKRLSEIQRSQTCAAFDVNPYLGVKMPFYQTFSMLANLFEMIKIFLVNEDSMVEKYFRIAVRYLKAKQFDVRQMIVENLKELYFTMRKSFPLGGFLNAYEEIVTFQPMTNKKSSSSDLIAPIAQNFDFEFFIVISKDQSLVQEEIVKALNVALKYFMQINGDCFLEIILNLLKFKESAQWCASMSEQILGKWTQIKLPSLVSNVYKRKSPQEMCRFEAFGVKRRQILKFQEYQKYKLLLDRMCQLKDGSFLRFYGQRVNKKIQEINRNKDLAAYNIFLKKLLQKIRLSKTLLPEPVELASKSLIYLSEGMGRNDSMQNDIEEINDQDGRQAREINDSKFKKLKDQIGQSPIRHNLKEIQMIKSEKNAEKFEKNSIPRTDEELNEFLMTKNKTLKNLNTFNDSPDQKNADQPTVQQQNLIKPYTEQLTLGKILAEHGQNIFIYPEQLQQFEVTYVKIQKQNNEALLNICSQIYVESMQQGHKQSGLIRFLQQLKLSKYLPHSQTVFVWKKTLQLNQIEIQHHQNTGIKQNISPQQNQNEIPYPQLSQQKANLIVWQLLFQFSFLMFGFKRNTRVRIKLLEIFLKLLTSNLLQRNQIHQKISSQIQPQTIMKRQMHFENQLISAKILKWNPQYQNKYLKGELLVPKSLKKKYQKSRQQMADQILEGHQAQKDSKIQNIEKIIKPKYEMKEHIQNKLQPWLICFQVLNDILALPTKEKSLGLGLIEPVSKITTSMFSPESKQETLPKRNYIQNQDQSQSQQEELNDRELQLMMLQNQLQMLQQNTITAKSPFNKVKKASNLVQSNSPKILQDKLKSKLLGTESLKVNQKNSQQASERLPNTSFTKIPASQLKQKIRSRKQKVKQQIIRKPQVDKLDQQTLSNRHNQNGEKISYNIDS